MIFEYNKMPKDTFTERFNHTVIGKDKNIAYITYPHYKKILANCYLPTGPAWTNNSHSSSSETCQIQVELSA